MYYLYMVIAIILFGVFGIVSGTLKYEERKNYIYFIKVDGTEYTVDPNKQKLSHYTSFFGDKSVTFVTEDGLEITSNNFEEKRILRGIFEDKFNVENEQSEGELYK